MNTILVWILVTVSLVCLCLDVKPTLLQRNVFKYG